uniref:Gamma-secretase subunit PEN-2 n=1 Tax=Oncorhynchus tshawytscha TaxID=74940 RepID=A0AAZ3P846_ONCTS
MNLERLPNEEKLTLCRKYYFGGFAFLPFLWLVNVVWFFKEAFVEPTYTEQLQIKTCECQSSNQSQCTQRKCC